MEDENYHQVGDNYKGIFYNEEEPEERYFEYGAHFRYSDLFQLLENLKNSFTGSRREEHMADQKQRIKGKSMESFGSDNRQYVNPSGGQDQAAAPHSQININLNNFYINNNDFSKSRNAQNHNKSRNIVIPGHSLKFQLDQAFKNGLNLNSNTMGQIESKLDLNEQIQRQLKNDSIEKTQIVMRKLDIKTKIDPSKRMTSAFHPIKKIINSHVEATEQITQDDFKIKTINNDRKDLSRARNIKKPIMQMTTMITDSKSQIKFTTKAGNHNQKSEYRYVHTLNIISLLKENPSMSGINKSSAAIPAKKANSAARNNKILVSSDLARYKNGLNLSAEKGSYLNSKNNKVQVNSVENRFVDPGAIKTIESRSISKISDVKSDKGFKSKYD